MQITKLPILIVLYNILVGVMHANHAIMAILITVKMEDLGAL